MYTQEVDFSVLREPILLLYLTRHVFVECDMAVHNSLDLSAGLAESYFQEVLLLLWGHNNF